MEKANHDWLVKQKNKMLYNPLAIARNLNNERKRIAKPHVYALKKQLIII